ncbi:hypothetical protein HN51_036591 [Arachis hypogaea]|uniref:Membrane-associated kinase regulator n=1 Tax=Arachis hypogaea TaxID=3818 RepID=A0A444ZZA0_ARAHY|nr:probable membrane-associated kinase regulator 2 [Arachis ipaensis]XP_025637092.1 probable membrane-associated kinase regulator 2 [Arachis hypogaea]QHO01982.1 putative membrane-associated kinase regulator [Arachis hypogaea]RYR19497.1 hypothetical protein Ahy_B03g064280 [Arachis hypogaea]
MEVFTFLKYWRGGGGAEGRVPPPPPPPPAAPETTDEEEGPFIDLEFTLPNESQDHSHHSPQVHSSDSDDDGHISFTLSPSTNNHHNMELHLDPSSSFLNSNSDSDSNPNPPLPPPPFTASFLKSATKFRVFMLGLKKPKPNPTQQGKLCTVKFKVEEVPILSFFTRDNTSKPRASSNNKHESHSLSSPPPPSSCSSSSEEKRLMHKYLRMVKPLYIKISRNRCADDKLNVNASPPPQNQGEDGGSDESEGSKLLGKSRSASAAVLVSSRRRDDSLLQQHDGIQSAILHCKRSFNASRECESSQLPRSVSNPLHDT